MSATPGAAQSDEAAYQLLALGYSARETADVVSGRISQQTLDTAPAFSRLATVCVQRVRRLDRALRAPAPRDTNRDMRRTRFPLLIYKRVERALVDRQGEAPSDRR